MALRFCTEACGAGASSSDASAQVCHQQTLSAVNFAISITERAGIEVLPGVNLPMLVKLASHRNRPIVEAVRLAQEAGRNQINIASHMLGTGRLLGAMNTAELRNDGSK